MLRRATARSLAPSLPEVGQMEPFLHQLSELESVATEAALQSPPSCPSPFLTASGTAWFKHGQNIVERVASSEDESKSDYVQRFLQLIRQQGDVRFLSMY